MKNINILALLFATFILHSCITTKDVRYMQPSESLTVNEDGLVSYNMQKYRVTSDDMFNLNIVTTPNGDAAQFYSSLYANSTAPGGRNNSGVTTDGKKVRAAGGVVDNNRVDTQFYYDGLRLNSEGQIYVFGIGYIPALGRTVEEIQKDIQDKVNENFVVGKSEVRLNIDGIHYYFLGDVESTGLTGEKVSHSPSINILEAIAENGGLNRSIDRNNVTVIRKYPEGEKIVKLDLTREDLVNSPYYWIQNGDLIMLNTRQKSLYGFGKNPVQTLTTGVSVLATLLSVYLIIKTL